MFDPFSGFFKVTLFPVGRETNGGVTGGVIGGVTGGVNRVLLYIEQHPGTQSAEVAGALDLSRRTVERHLKALKDKNLVRFVGAPKTGGYHAMDKG